MGWIGNAWNRVTSKKFYTDMGDGLNKAKDGVWNTGAKAGGWVVGKVGDGFNATKGAVAYAATHPIKAAGDVCNAGVGAAKWTGGWMLYSVDRRPKTQLRKLGLATQSVVDAGASTLGMIGDFGHAVVWDWTTRNIVNLGLKDEDKHKRPAFFGFTKKLEEACQMPWTPEIEPFLRDPENNDIILTKDKLDENGNVILGEDGKPEQENVVNPRAKYERVYKFGTRAVAEIPAFAVGIGFASGTAKATAGSTRLFGKMTEKSIAAARMKAADIAEAALRSADDVAATAAQAGTGAGSNTSRLFAEAAQAAETGKRAAFRRAVDGAANQLRVVDRTLDRIAVWAVNNEGRIGRYALGNNVNFTSGAQMGWDLCNPLQGRSWVGRTVSGTFETAGAGLSFGIGITGNLAYANTLGEANTVLTIAGDEMIDEQKRAIEAGDDPEAFQRFLDSIEADEDAPVILEKPPETSQTTTGNTDLRLSDSFSSENGSSNTGMGHTFQVSADGGLYLPNGQRVTLLVPEKEHTYGLKTPEFLGKP